MPKRKQKIDVPEGLNQTFKLKNGKTKKLIDVLKEGDWWELKKQKHVVYILLHSAVKKIADEAGIKSNPEYKILTQPNYDNNYQYTIQITITDAKGRSTTDIGEVNRSNLGLRGRNNPANMAQKRAYDRAVLTHLGIQGFLGEDELEDSNEEKRNMEELTPDQQQNIAPLINDVLLAKTRKDLVTFSVKMKKIKDQYTPQQQEVLRGLLRKKLSEFEKTF